MCNCTRRASAELCLCIYCFSQFVESTDEGPHFIKIWVPILKKSGYPWHLATVPNCSIVFYFP